MSMLAERRKKNRYVINPTKKPLWTTDSSGIKFGKELMEKMGWSAGKGLGANEQGIQEPLRVSYKNDNKGMGYKGSEENWIEYQDEFNVLLNQLANNTDNVKTKEAEKSQVISLEEKSKLSKARVHYQKFTRGKDISKYSENDLSCILGTGKMKKTNETAVEKETPPENKVHETSFGVTTINSGSIKDYFKNKWTLNNLKTENSSVELSQSVFDEEQQFNEKTKTGLDKKLKKIQKENKETLKHEYGIEENENVEEETKKHKKKRKNLNLDVEILCKKEKKIKAEIDDKVEKIEKNQLEVYSSLEDNFKSKKKKKKKRDSEGLQELEPVVAGSKTQLDVPDEEKIKKKKRKKEKESEVNSMENNLNEEEISGNLEGDPQNETQKEDFTKKKKRKKEKKAKELLETDNNCEIEVNAGAVIEKAKNDTEVDAEENTSKKKKKKKRDAEFKGKDKNDCKDQPDDQQSQLEDVEEMPVKRKKKKKEKGAEDLQKGGMENGDENAGEKFQIDVVKEKKKKKHFEESEKKKELRNEGFLGMEVAVEAVLTEKKKVKSTRKENAEALCQPEEVRKRTKKNKKEKKENDFVNRDDQVEAGKLENQDKESKRKDKIKSKSCSETADTSKTFRETKNEMNDSREEKENKSEKLKSKGEVGVTLIHTHKAALFQIKKPFVNSFKECSTGKALKLICGAEISKFKGANLGSIPGYGYQKDIESERRL